MVNRLTLWIIAGVMTGIVGYRLVSGVKQESLGLKDKSYMELGGSVKVEIDKGVDVENDFGYLDSNPWHIRMDVLEELARKNNMKIITPETISDLEVIAHADSNQKVRELADSMVNSYNVKGDFSGTGPYDMYHHTENLRLTIRTSVDFGYRASDEWYDRMEALENLARDPKVYTYSEKLIKLIVNDLRRISTKDDDRMIRDLADSMVQSYKQDKDFSGVARNISP